jgi:hypothetical protein
MLCLIHRNDARITRKSRVKFQPAAQVHLYRRSRYPHVMMQLRKTIEEHQGIHAVEVNHAEAARGYGAVYHVYA